MKFRNNHIILFISVVSVLLIWCFFQFYYAYHLFHKEQIQLFVYSQDVIFRYFESPACISNLAGDFLTQFFYLIGGGPIIIALSLMLLGYLGFSVFWRILTNNWLSFGLALLLVSWELGRLSLLSYPLSSTYSLIGSLGLCLICTRFKSDTIRLIVLVVSLLAGFWMFGYGVYFTAILSVAYEIKLRKWKTVIAVAVVVFLLPTKLLSFPTWFGLPNFKIERILAADNEYYFGNYDKLAIVTSTPMEADHVTYYYNLLNACRGVLPDSLMSYYQPATLGLFLPVDTSSSYLSIMFANEVWFKLGDMTMAEHCAMLSMISSPNSTGARMIKRLAEINLINNDEQAALKYLRILKKTLFYSDWAEQRMPENKDASIRSWLSDKRQFIPQHDTIRASADIKLSLRQLLKSNPKNTIAYDYLLCYNLLQKDIDGFVQDYNPTSVPNRLYAEALLIYAANKRLSSNELKKYQISPEVIAEFNDYTQIYEKYSGDGRYLSGKYGKTYWFYFHYATLKTL